MKFIHYYLFVIAFLMAKLSVSQRGPIIEIPMDVTKAIPTITHVSCVGGTNGSVVLTPSGNGQPYTYTWQPGNTGGNSITGKGVGNYTVNIYPPAFTLVLAGTYTYDIGYKANWTNLYPGLIVSGDDLLQNRTDMAGTWLEAAYTTNTLLASTDGWIQYVITNTGYNKAIGFLDVPGGTYAGYGDIDYGLMFNSGGSITRLNSGSFGSISATYAVGDIIKIERIGSTINYKINNVIISTETVPSGILSQNWVAKGVVFDYGARLEKLGCSFPPFYGSAGAPQTISCITPSVTLSGSSSAPGVSYSWNPGGSTPTSSTTTVGTAGIYTLSITNSTVGCTAIYTVAVTGSAALSNVSAGSNQTITCTNPSVTLTGSSTSTNVTYYWLPGGATTATRSASSAGTYTLKVTDPSGCSGTSTVLVVANTTGPTITISTSALTATVCAGSTVTLTASGASTYTWTSGATTSAVVVSPVVTTTYSVSGTGTNGCVSTQTVNVIVGSLLVNAGIPVFVSSGTIVGLGGSPSASLGSGSYSYSWTPSASYSPSSTSSNPTITAVSSVNYTLTVKDLATGCIKTDVKIVSIGDPPFCSVLKKTLDASYYTIINGKLYFTLDGDYSQTGLNYKVYNYSRTVMTGLSVNNTFLENGDNRFKMDVATLATGFYVLEVINQKNEKLLLRFKK